MSEEIDYEKLISVLPEIKPGSVVTVRMDHVPNRSAEKFLDGLKHVILKLKICPVIIIPIYHGIEIDIAGEGGAFGDERMRAVHWRVEVYADGEQILAIEPEIVAGDEITPDYADTIRHCADHLRGFVGQEGPQVCFCCGGFGYENAVYDGRIPCPVCSAPNALN
ncbi:MAG: hypothetical protein M0Q44_01300 [Methylobacter sp.]|nr:hypothetical protein [Methylobacter sp.]